MKCTSAHTISVCTFSDILITSPEKCEEELKSILLQFNIVISRWEMSEQGDESVEISDATNDYTFGMFKN